jgi:hypothetical protein
MAGGCEHRRVRHAVQLRAHRGVEGRMAVAVHGAPQRGDAVEVGVAVGVPQRAALAALDDRRVLGRPSLLLGERVPDGGAVGGAELGGRHGPNGMTRHGRHRVR